MTEQNIEIEAPDEPSPGRCLKCATPFDQADTRFDGAGQYYETGYCRRCVDLCHEATEFDHVCKVCELR